MCHLAVAHCRMAYGTVVRVLFACAQMYTYISLVAPRYIYLLHIAVAKSLFPYAPISFTRAPMHSINIIIIALHSMCIAILLYSLVI